MYYFEELEPSSPEPLPQQAAWIVSALPFLPPSSYLRPGSFLVSHPYMQDSFFSKTVICILEDKDDTNNESASKRNEMPDQTYGIIVNRVSVNPRYLQGNERCRWGRNGSRYAGSSVRGDLTNWILILTKTWYAFSLLVDDISFFVGVSTWAPGQKEYERARSIFEQALRYDKFEMRNEFINHARNFLDRIIPS
jgi:hypothetical protein